MMRVSILLVAFVACGVTTARAADLPCLSLSAARAKFPNVHLWWHYDAARKQCWDASAPIHRRAGQHRAPPPLQTSVPVPRSTVLWPALSLTATPVDAALFTTEPATAWPLLLDVDELTGGPVADCCWPPLDEPPFTDRWFALPSNWFAAVTR